jgi:5-methyltetrahydrofolate--homocysteine methyltransferase
LSIINRLDSGEILICDGAVGINLQLMGCEPGESIEKCGLEHSDILKKLHSNYIEAGADIILTNTLGGNRIKLDRYGLANEIELLNKGLAELALDVASGFSKTVYVAGNVGPTTKLMEPYGELTESEAMDVFSQQIKILVDSGVDFIFIETMTDVNETACAVKASKAICDLPVFALMSFDPGKRGFRTVLGNSPEQAVELLQSAGAEVVGSNCGSVFAPQMPELIKQFKEADARFVAVEPNAGIPQMINGKTVFPHTPQDMAIHIPAMIDAGANVVGGCCGTTPEHIRLIAESVSKYNAQKNRI